MFDWVGSLWDTFLQWLAAYWMAAITFLEYLPVMVVSGVLDAIAAVFESIPVPSFLSTHSMGSYLNGIDPAVLYFLNMSGFDVAIGIVGSGVAFRLLRKAFTLGQW